MPLRHDLRRHVGGDNVNDIHESRGRQAGCRREREAPRQAGRARHEARGREQVLDLGVIVQTGVAGHVGARRVQGRERHAAYAVGAQRDHELVCEPLRQRGNERDVGGGTVPTLHALARAGKRREVLLGHTVQHRVGKPGAVGRDTPHQLDALAYGHGRRRRKPQELERRDAQRISHARLEVTAAQVGVEKGVDGSGRTDAPQSEPGCQRAVRRRKSRHRRGGAQQVARAGIPAPHVGEDVRSCYAGE